MMKKTILFYVIIALILSSMGQAFAGKKAEKSESAKPKKSESAKPKKSESAKEKKIEADKEIDISKVIKEVKYTGFDKRDPFAVNKQLAKMLKTPEILPGQKETPVKMPAVDVQGVIWSKRMPQVIINDAVMKAGDFIGEFEIKEVTRNGIILFHKGVEYKLGIQNSEENSKSKKKKK
ncbi:MAG: hypothetical protein HY810_02580 [Candidatus Omnitrophica bacterium]|nr:hypothetical protein [Candidatus Omnitrophota bacterium]